MPDQDEVFDLDALYAEVAKPPFVFRWAGLEWTLPWLGDMDWRVTSMADDMDVEEMKKLFSLALSAEQAAAWESVPQPASVMVKLFNQWINHSGAEPGEAQGSGDSSKSTAGPSKRTSRGTTRSGSRKPSTARTRTAAPPANSST